MTKLLWIMFVGYLLAILLAQTIVCSRAHPPEPPPPQEITTDWLIKISDQREMAVAGFVIDDPGEYQIRANVKYSSRSAGQRNESFYLMIVRGDHSAYVPARNGNAGDFNVVIDNDLEGWRVRDCGVWYLENGEYTIDVVHYASIADDYPQFKHFEFGKHESVQGDKFIVEFAN